MTATAIAALFGLGFLPLVVMAIALWPLRWWQVGLVLLCPIVTAAALIEGSPLQALGWLPLYGIPWSAHLVAPWPVFLRKRFRARVAVPSTVIGIQLVVAVVTRQWMLLVYFALPLISSGIALLLAWGEHLDARDRDRDRATTT